MFLIGATPQGRNIEQHDVFFGIGESVKEMIPEIVEFWPEAREKMHIDAWREVTVVEGYKVTVVAANDEQFTGSASLFFINLGGYKPDEFEEFHYKLIIPAIDKTGAITRAKQTAFFKHTGFAGAPSHVDDKFGIDVDDLFEIKDILPEKAKAQYRIVVTKDSSPAVEDIIHLGYFKPASFQ